VSSLRLCLLFLTLLLGTARADAPLPPSWNDTARPSPVRPVGMLDILLIGAGCLMVGDVLRGLFMPVSAFSRPKESLRLLPGVKQSQASEAQRPDPADHAWVAAPTPG